MTDKAAPPPPLPTKKVRCMYCNGFLFNVVITAQNPVVGEFGRITDFHCKKCKRRSMVAIGVADGDRRDDVKKIEDQIKKGMEAK